MAHASSTRTVETSTATTGVSPGSTGTISPRPGMVTSAVQSGPSLANLQALALQNNNAIDESPPIDYVEELLFYACILCAAIMFLSPITVFWPVAMKRRHAEKQRKLLEQQREEEEEEEQLLNETTNSRRGSVASYKNTDDQLHDKSPHMTLQQRTPATQQTPATQLTPMKTPSPNKQQRGTGLYVDMPPLVIMASLLQCYLWSVVGWETKSRVVYVCNGGGGACSLTFAIMYPFYCSCRDKIGYKSLLWKVILVCSIVTIGTYLSRFYALQVIVNGGDDISDPIALQKYTKEEWLQCVAWVAFCVNIVMYGHTVPVIMDVIWTKNVDLFGSLTMNFVMFANATAWVMQASWYETGGTTQILIANGLGMLFNIVALLVRVWVTCRTPDDEDEQEYALPPSGKISYPAPPSAGRSTMKYHASNIKDSPGDNYCSITLEETPEDEQD